MLTKSHKPINPLKYNQKMTLKYDPLIIGIAGGTGSGKTTVANVILKRVGKDHIAYLPHDAYYRDLRDLPHDQKTAFNFDHPNSLETELMIEHIKELKNGNSVNIPVYDFSTNSRTAKTIKVDPHPVVVVEGILLFVDKDLRDLLDIRIFVDTDPDIRFIRRLTRDLSERGRTTENGCPTISLDRATHACRICRTFQKVCKYDYPRGWFQPCCNGYGDRTN